jgi:hypothetical protein
MSSAYNPIRIALASALFILAATGIYADERMFAYSYQADSVLPKGKVETEQWATLRSGKGSGQYARWDIRHEIEYGFTDTFTGGLYLNFTNKFADGVANISDTNGTYFDGMSLELKQMMLSPYKNPIGVLLYVEPTYSGKEFELEGKLVLESIVDEKWHFVTNLVTEQEWEYSSTGTTHESAFKITGGAAYQLNPTLSVGFEGKITTKYSGFYSSAESTTLFVGPNIHFGDGKFNITAAVLTQLTSVYTSAESLEARVITGINF